MTTYPAAPTDEPTRALYAASDSRGHWPVRTGIVRELSEGGKYVHQLDVSLEVNQPLVSQRLRVLRTSRIVTAQRQAREIRYVLTEDHVATCGTPSGTPRRRSSSVEVGNPPWSEGQAKPVGQHAVVGHSGPQPHPDRLGVGHRDDRPHAHDSSGGSAVHPARQHGRMRGPNRSPHLPPSCKLRVRIHSRGGTGLRMARLGAGRL
ncbi:ArsR/SmtB family transcription factor [Streptomyces spongiae]|uniref:ArsR/SmtB family transcription factor n=1 Tax=Streptomyces spongiae TaxID=565072 RepID=UPI001D149C02|nr:helix-turn-helix domain-containing protein [Streptomyces spongiae]